MKTILTLQNGRSVYFEINSAPQQASFFVLGIKKCGSTLLNYICRRLAKQNNTNYIDVADGFFDENIDGCEWYYDPAIRNIIVGGNAYGGFRHCPIQFHEMETYKHAQKVLLIRDPRDALVSEYFSITRSHPLPSLGEDTEGARGAILAARQLALSESIDQYVLRKVHSMKEVFLDHFSTSDDKRTITLMYETFIFNKESMIKAIASHFGWTFDEQTLSDILRHTDVVPDSEDVTSFIRRVRPGDHREKLSSSTINILNYELGPVLEFYHFDL